MKKLYFLILLVLASCQKQNKSQSPEIHLGNPPISEVSINRLTTRNIVLTGGDGRFTADIENSKIAHISVVKDTLKVRGLLEGETFARVFSHDKSAELKIKVIPSDITISHEEIRLFPDRNGAEVNKLVSVNGGGEVVDLEIDDPHKILKVLWNGRTSILELRGLAEGEATIRAVSRSKTNPSEKTLRVVVESTGELKKVGFYEATSKFFGSLINNIRTIEIAEEGVWISENPNGYKGFADPRGELFLQKAVKISPVISNPVKGQKLKIQVSFSPYHFSHLSAGEHSVVIDEVRDDVFVLKGRGFRFVLPRNVSP